MKNSIWLVEIRLKDWIDWGSPTPRVPSRVVSYEEVIAQNEYAARHAGFDQFALRCKYEPILKRKMEALDLKTNDCCAPDAVELDG